MKKIIDQEPAVRLSTESAFARLSASGEIRLASAPHWTYDVSPVQVADNTVRTLLDEARGLSES